jgi:hypothetical protein
MPAGGGLPGKEAKKLSALLVNARTSSIAIVSRATTIGSRIPPTSKMSKSFP